MSPITLFCNFLHLEGSGIGGAVAPRRRNCHLSSVMPLPAAVSGQGYRTRRHAAHSYSTFSAAFRQRMHKNVTDWMREEVLNHI